MLQGRKVSDFRPAIFAARAQRGKQILEKCFEKKKNLEKRSFTSKNIEKKDIKTKILITKIYNNINKCDTIVALLAPLDRNRGKDRE